MAIIQDSLPCDFVHELLCIIGESIDSASILTLQLNSESFLGWALLGSVAITDSVTSSLRMYRGIVLSTDISSIIVILLEVKPLLCELALHEIADDHALTSIRNVALVADVRPSQSVISSYHHTPDLRSLESANRPLRFRLQPILEDLESIEKQPLLSLIPSHAVHGRLIDWLAGNAEHSEPVRCVVGQDFLVVGWHALLLHDGSHHFGRALSINLTALGDAVLADDTHPLEVGIELKPAVDESTMATLTLETEDDLRIGMLLVELEPSEEECLDLHGIANQFIL